MLLRALIHLTLNDTPYMNNGSSSPLEFSADGTRVVGQTMEKDGRLICAVVTGAGIVINPVWETA